jgi:pimeloyl-ACP methyl ester carboxylesterase
VDRELAAITRGDARLVADVVGDGPPIVLLHGHGYSRASWFAVAEELRRSFRRIAPDQRGFGDSSGSQDASWSQLAEDVRGWVDFAGEPPLIVGHSWGGKIALVAAAVVARPIRGVYCVDGIAINHGGSLGEDVYEQIRAPVGALFANVVQPAGGLGYDPDEVREWATRNRGVLVDWIDTGHDVPGEAPRELALRIAEFDRRSG